MKHLNQSNQKWQRRVNIRKFIRKYTLPVSGQALFHFFAIKLQFISLTSANNLNVIENSLK